MNRSAREIVGANDGLSISGRSLRLASSAAALALRAMIATVNTRFAETKPLHVTVPRASGALPYRIVAAPIRGNESAVFPPTASVMLVVTDRARANRFTHHLVDVYALTPAETALASALADGYTLQEYASEHAISIDTARAHLKRVMDKTNTHRQAELVNLILTSPAAVLRS